MVGWLRIVGGAIGLSLTFAAAIAEAQDRPGPVGLRQIAFADGERTIALSMFYPARNDGATKPFFFPFFGQRLRAARRAAAFGRRAPSPDRLLARARQQWPALRLVRPVSRRAGLRRRRHRPLSGEHLRFDIAYLANRLWQRPVDIGLAISFLLRDPPGPG